MKHLLLAALLAVMSLPAFAQVQSSGQDELLQNTGDEQTMDDQNFTPAEEQSMDEQALPPQWPGRPDRPDRPGWPGHRPDRPDRPGHGGWPGHGGGHWMFTCYARDFVGRQFYGRGYSQWQARRNALYGCQRASLPIPIRSCRLIGCERSWN